MLKKNYSVILLIIFCISTCISNVYANNKQDVKISGNKNKSVVKALILGAKAQMGTTVSYNPAYKTLSYPNGDVPMCYGVCTDVIVRAFRVIGFDLQKLIHEDMQKNWTKYPKKWGLKRPDKNIDHRRVPNLATFFDSIGMKTNNIDLIAGDIIIWNLGGGTLHIGLLSDINVDQTPLVIHNICCGVQQENILNQYTIVGAYRLTDGAIKKLQALSGH